MFIRLNALPVGGEARVLSLDAHSQMRRRLLDLGFTRGAKARCLYESPSGNPRAYWVRGAVIALRNGDAGQILLGEEGGR